MFDVFIGFILFRHSPIFTSTKIETRGQDAQSLEKLKKRKEKVNYSLVTSIRYTRNSFVCIIRIHKFIE